MTHCAKCGACTAVCPVYRVTGRESLTARGKIHLLERLPTANCSARYADIISKCLLCGACQAACSRGIDLIPRIVAARRDLPLLVGDHPLLGRLVEKTLSTPVLLAAVADLGATIQRLLPNNSGLRLRLGLPPESRIPAAKITAESQQAPSPQNDVAYFSGCLARYPQPEISHATQLLLTQHLGSKPHIPAGQVCCGQAAYSGGKQDDAIQLAKLNISAFANNDLPILTSCASCYHHLSLYPELLQDDKEWAERARIFADRLREFSTFFADLTPKAAKSPLAGNKLDKKTVFYHDPCHLRFHPQIMEPPRRLLTKAGFLIHNLPQGPQCCGMGGLFHLAQPQLAEKIRNHLLTDLEQLSVDVITTTCSGCLLQLRTGVRQKQPPTKVQHLAVLLAEQLKT